MLLKSNRFEWLLHIDVLFSDIIKVKKIKWTLLKLNHERQLFKLSSDLNLNSSFYDIYFYSFSQAYMFLIRFFFIYILFKQTILRNIYLIFASSLDLFYLVFPEAHWLDLLRLQVSNWRWIDEWIDTQKTDWQTDWQTVLWDGDMCIFLFNVYIVMY